MLEGCGYKFATLRAHAQYVEVTLRLYDSTHGVKGISYLSIIL